MKTVKRYPILKASRGDTVDPTATRQTGPLRDLLRVELMRELRLNHEALRLRKALHGLVPMEVLRESRLHHESR